MFLVYNYVGMAVIVLVITFFWVSGIDYMRQNHPDYKGDQDGFNFDDKKGTEIYVLFGTVIFFELVYLRHNSIP